MFAFDQNEVEMPEDMTELWGDQSCDGGINRWTHASNSISTYNGAINGGTWSDPGFGADTSSLYWGKQGLSGGFQASTQKIVAWKRPSEIFKGQAPSLLGNLGKPAPTGINQGQVGDCWYLASLAAVAEDPKRMADRITNAGVYPSSGIFRFTFW